MVFEKNLNGVEAAPTAFGVEIFSKNVEFSLSGIVLVYTFIALFFHF